MPQDLNPVYQEEFKALNNKVDALTRAVVSIMAQLPNPALISDEDVKKLLGHEFKPLVEPTKERRSK